MKVRYWSVNHARTLNCFYRFFERVIIALSPLFSFIGFKRLDKPFAAVERVVKGALFDCQMCGRCILSFTGMACSMNCPKQLRNGPCGGVRQNGHCEVQPEMRCVWVEAVRGSENMGTPEAIAVVQLPVDRRLKDTSAWLRVVQESEQNTEGCV